MNNDAFQKLVRERASEKSSKEIAREAVEEEFQQHSKSQRNRGSKRKKKGGGGGSSDEDDDSDVDDDRKRKKDEKQQKQEQDKQSKQGAGKKEKVASKYRDRAKERREGNNTDYQDSQRLLSSVAAAAQDAQDDDNNDNLETISKFLGGDEAYTHLVKGLDVTLAKRSVKKDTTTARPTGYSTSIQPRETGDVNATDSAHFAESQTDAKELIDTDLVLVSELGRDMLDYLRNFHASMSTRSLSKDAAVAVALTVTPAGLVAQRSTLTFSLRANLGEFARSWEIPKEQTYGTTSDGRAYTKASPLARGLLDRIEHTLSKRKQKRTMLAPPEQKTKISEPSTTTRAATSINASECEQDENSEDDDIFGNVGDYVPTDEPNDNNGVVANGVGATGGHD